MDYTRLQPHRRDFRVPCQYCDRERRDFTCYLGRVHAVSGKGQCRNVRINIKHLCDIYLLVRRLLEYPERKAVLATLVFILNSLSTSPGRRYVEIRIGTRHLDRMFISSLMMVRNAGGRATCVSLLEKCDKIFEDEQNEDLFQMM
jgi:hypothetical protein